VDWSGRHLTPSQNRGKVETPQAERRGGGFFHESENNLPLLPAESKCLQRKGTANFISKNNIILEKSQDK
jgi:hypothetical protein